MGADEDRSVQEDSEMTMPPSPRGPSQGQSQLLGWLTSSALADTVSACMADVTDAALRIKDEGGLGLYTSLLNHMRFLLKILMVNLWTLKRKKN